LCYFSGSAGATGIAGILHLVLGSNMPDRGINNSQNELNDLKELRSLTGNIKRGFYEEYKLPSTIARKLESNNKYNNIIQCEAFGMNISESEVPVKIVAKTCGCREKNTRKVTYQFIDSYHSLCLDKKDVIYAELEACERLLKYASDEGDKTTTSNQK
jgi:hypothetical protein